MVWLLLTSPSSEKIRILSILFLTTQRDPRKFPASTAVPVLAFPSSYLKVPILCHGNEETTNDVAAITLLEKAIANNLTFNANKFVFKSPDCAVFRGHLNLAWYKMDPNKVQAISEMKPPENLQDLQSFLGLVNYLNRYSTALADLTAPLRAVCKKDTLFTWESSQQAAFEAISRKRSRVHLCWHTLISTKLALFRRRLKRLRSEIWSNIKRELLGVKWVANITKVGRGLFRVHLLILHFGFQFSKSITVQNFIFSWIQPILEERISPSQNGQTLPIHVHKTAKQSLRK